MGTLAIELTLLGDLVQTADSATVGPHRSLEYLKGSNLLGVAAAALYDDLGADAYTVFHSGRVRFLDAKPLSPEGLPATPVPLGWFRPKGVPYADAGRLRPEVIHCLPHVTSQQMAELGLEVIGGGHFTPSGAWVDPPRRYRLKTAVDAATGGGPERGGLFGYDALAAGSRWLARIDLDEDVEESIRERLASVFDKMTAWLGRSRAAEYGRVKARLVDAPDGEEKSRPRPAADDAPRPHRVTLVLASDLALLDPETAEPTLSARAEHFGLPPEFRLDPQASQVVARRYSPFNAKRGYRDTAHVVLGRGSVLTFRAPAGPEPLALDAVERGLRAGVGLFRQEGLGQVEVEPWYLRHLHPDFAPSEAAEPARSVHPATASPDSALTRWITLRHRDHRAAEEAFAGAAEAAKPLARLVERLRRNGRPAPGRSQWNRLASVVRRHLDGGAPSVESVQRSLENELFGTGDAPAHVAANLWRQEVEGGALWERVLEKGLGDGAAGDRARLLRLQLTALLVVRELSQYRMEKEAAE